MIFFRLTISFISFKLKCIEMKTWEICYADEQKSMKKTDGKMMAKKSIKKMEKMEKALKKMMEKLVKQKWCKNDEKTVKKPWKSVENKTIEENRWKNSKKEYRKNELFMSKKMMCVQLKQNRSQNEIMKIMKILKRIYVSKRKKSIRLPKLWHGQLCSERQMQSIVMSIFMKIRAKIHWASV